MGHARRAFLGFGWETSASSAFAASVSASCLLPPSAVASASLGISARTVKRGAWPGPERSTTS